MFILPLNMFSVTIALFFLLLISEYVQKANELVRKQQKPAQSQYGILEASMIKFHFDNILLSGGNAYR